MIQHYTSETLVSSTSGGASKFWRIHVLTDEDGVYTQTESWRVLQSGLKSEPQLSAPAVVEGKNIGRSNETTPLQQAISEAKSLVAKKLDVGYHVEGQEEVQLLPLPMLAKKFDDAGHHIKYPAAVQPKLDGVRMLFDGTKGWSRNRKLFIPEIIQHLMLDTEGLILDGELMLPHDKYSFQQTISAVKKFGPLAAEVEYHVYDIVDTARTFQQRHRLLVDLITSIPEGNVKLVPTHTVSNEQAITNAHEDFLHGGYEGTMIRNLDGMYKLKDRSSDLQKYKDFQDDDFTIVDVVQGTAKHEGCAIFVCETNNGQRFNTAPKMTDETRKQYFRDREQLIGRKLSVRYQNLSTEGIPRFPIGIAIRDYE